VVQLYVDGQQVASTNYSPASIPGHGDPAGVGGLNGGSVWGNTPKFFDGRIDDLRIFDGDALSAAQVADLHAGSGGSGGNLSGGGSNLPGTFNNGGNAWSVPATGTRRIQAEDFNTTGYTELTSGNDGGSSYRSDAPNVDLVGSAGNAQVGWFDEGEALGYTIDVATAGTYEVSLRLARDNTAAAYSLWAGQPGSLVNKSGFRTFAGTGWGNYETVTFTINLDAGEQLLEFRKGSVNGLNFDWLELRRV
ncbi:MAG: carbohydrate-binding protein, partial [Planctomycetota bacterium]